MNVLMAIENINVLKERRDNLHEILIRKINDRQYEGAKETFDNLMQHNDEIKWLQRSEVKLKAKTIMEEVYKKQAKGIVNN